MTTADKTSKAAQFVTKLLQLTQEQKIDWRPSSSPRDDGRTAFVAEVEGKRLRLYKYQTEMETYGLGNRFTFSSPPETRVVDITCLELVEGDLVTYTFEGISGLRDLYESTAYAASNVEALMDAVLEKT